MFTAKRPKVKASQQRRHFAPVVLRDSDFPHKLSFYTNPPTQEITIEEFQGWAIDRLLVLSEIESATYRNKTQAEINTLIKGLLDQYLPLSSNTSRTLKGNTLDQERKKDHYSHFILRLAFCRS